MGSTFAGLHVRTEDLAAVAATVRAALAQQGLSPSDQEADRNVALVPGGGWVALLDDAADGGDDAPLEGFASVLSGQLGAPAVLVRVFDSDALRLTLFEGGKQRDRFDSAPQIMGTRKTKPERHVAAWAHLAGAAPDALPDAFTRDALFAEAALGPLARALGMDAERVAVGYAYQAGAGWPAGTVHLHFRDAHAAALAPVAGPPRLAVSMVQAPPASAVGAPVVAVLHVRSNASGFHGLRVEVETDTDVVQWHAVGCSLLPPTPGRIGSVPLENGAAWLPVDVAAGVDLDPVALQKNPQRAIAALRACSFQIAAMGAAVAPGAATLTLRLRDGSGAVLGEAKAPVAVRSTERRPLRADPAVPPMMIDALDEEGWLNALVVCDLERVDAVARLQPVLQALAPYAPAEGRVARTIFPAGRGGLLAAFTMAAPKFWSGAAAGFFDGGAWKKTLSAAGEAAMVELRFGGQEDGPDTSTVRVALGSGVIAAPDTATVLAIAVQAAPPGAETALVAAIDAVARAGALTQAFVSRRGAPPAVEVTSYEQCCGVHGQCTTRRGWVRRWLRAVPDGVLWLGPELRSRVDASALPEGVAVGATLRVAVPDRVAIEPALANVLPTTHDWRRGVMGQY
ncbi:MAG: hypothetical protein ACKVU4_03395 [Phycisphaerales bacterium]